jgi:hypothetical protein
VTPRGVKHKVSAWGIGRGSKRETVPLSHADRSAASARRG